MSNLKHLNATELRETIDYSKGLIADAEQDIGNMENNIHQNETGIKHAKSRISGQRERIKWAEDYLEEKNTTMSDDLVDGFVYTWKNYPLTRYLSVGGVVYKLNNPYGHGVPKVCPYFINYPMRFSTLCHISEYTNED